MFECACTPCPQVRVCVCACACAVCLCMEVCVRTLHVCARVNTPNLRMLILWGRCAEVVGEAKRERPVVGGGLAAASGLSG